jgi:O-antigen ligase
MAWSVLALTAAGLTIPFVAVEASEQPRVTVAIAAVLGAVIVVTIAATRFELFTLLMIATRTAVEVSPGEDQAVRLAIFTTGAYTAIAGAWLIGRTFKQQLSVSRVAIAAIVVALAAVLSGALSADRQQALLGASRWVFLAVFIIVLENLVDDDRRVRRLLFAVAVSAVVPLALGSWQLLTGTGVVVDGVLRIEGSFSHPNTFGFYLAVMGLFLAGVFPQLKRWYRLGAGLLLALVVGNLAATYSRTSYVAFAVGLLVIVVLSRKWLLLALAVAAIALPLLAVPGITERFENIGAGPTLRGTPGDSLAWRLEYWPDLIAAGEGRRVTGLGLGVASDVTVQGREPHNDLVRSFVEMGTVGLAAYTAFLFFLGAQVMKTVRRTTRSNGPSGLSRALAVAFAGIFAAYLVGSMTSNLMTQLILLWYVMAVGVAATLPARVESEARK